MQLQMPRGKDSSGLVTEMLKKSKDTNGTSLFDHLSAFLSQIQPSSNDSFEFLSDFFKKHRFSHEGVKSVEEIKRLESYVREENEWKVKAKQLGEDLKKSKKQGYLYKPLGLSAGILQEVGISFGKKQTLLIDNSIRRLAEEVDAKELRFWGKILTRTQDYYVVQGISLKKNKTEIKPNVQKAGVGVNEYSYWVTQDYLSDWIELPLASPEHIVASQLINYIFSGDLNSEVKCYPPFPGKEKHLLKAILCRITHSLEISPKGLLVPSEAEGAEDEVQLAKAEDFTYPEFSQLSNLQTWVHSNKIILKEGRTSFFVDPSLPEQEREAKMGELDTSQKAERLRAISQDKSGKEPQGQGQEIKLWTTKVQGDTQVFKAPLDDQAAGETQYSVVSIKSLVWPGWTTVSDRKNFISVYIGYGLKANQNILHPMQPSNLGIQGTDIDEYPEPNPKQPLDELQPDSDDQNKKEDQDA